MLVVRVRLETDYLYFQVLKHSKQLGKLISINQHFYTNFSSGKVKLNCSFTLSKENYILCFVASRTIVKILEALNSNEELIEEFKRIREAGERYIQFAPLFAKLDIPNMEINDKYVDVLVAS